MAWGLKARPGVAPRTSTSMAGLCTRLALAAALLVALCSAECRQEITIIEASLETDEQYVSFNGVDMKYADDALDNCIVGCVNYTGQMPDKVNLVTTVYEIVNGQGTLYFQDNQMLQGYENVNEPMFKIFSDQSDFGPYPWKPGQYCFHDLKILPDNLPCPLKDEYLVEICVEHEKKCLFNCKISFTNSVIST